jgi:NitT/TauT family transport system ATP-binding protein
MLSGDMKDKNKASLSINNVSHSYGDVQVLNNLSLQVAAGEIVVIVGPSGCGKTTLLNVLSGYIKPSSGNVQTTGTIRTVYQQGGLFPWLTVAENIKMGLQLIKDTTQKDAELKALLGLIHLEDFSNHYPHELSGGMRQRVELARAIAGDSDILLMDEPFSALDYQTRLRMRLELLRLLRERQRTVVFVTHDIEEAVQLADRVLVLSGRPATVKRTLVISERKPREVSNPAVVNAMEEILGELDLRIKADTLL